MKAVYRALAYLVALLVVVQLVAIAIAVFTLAKNVDDGLVADKDYLENHANWAFQVHSFVGFSIIPLVALLLLIVSLFAKVPGGTKWAGFTFLAVALQIILATVSFGIPIIGGLHALNAFVVAGCASRAGSLVGRERQATPQEAPAPTT